jgi:hypothetical protein
MTFDDQNMTVESPFGRINVVISGDALHVLWGEGVGPQDAAGIIASNREMLKQIAIMKYEADAVEEDGSLRITDLDVEN